MGNTLIIGERINTSRKHIASAVEKRNKSFILKEAVGQTNAGADLIDINCSSLTGKESEHVLWVLKILSEETNLAFCIDSPDSEVIKIALSKYPERVKMINSITAQSSRYENILPLVKEYNKSVIALAMGGNGIPVTLEERLDVVSELKDIFNDYQIDKKNVYIDALVRPISTEQEQAAVFINSVSEIKKNFGFKTIGGISNISYGLPARNVINAFFINLCLFNGLDAVITDPLQKLVTASIKASGILKGEDMFCGEFIKAWREKKI